MAEPLLLEDIRNKLHNTVCRHKGVPVRVDTSHINRDNQKLVACKELGSEHSFNVDYTLDDFDYSSPPLGWFIRGSRARYLTRVPGRFNNLGLVMSNLDEPIDAQSFYSTSMKDCILGTHKSFDVARKEIWEADSNTIPFHRHAAIIRSDRLNATIKYINKDIGFVTKSGNLMWFDVSSKDGINRIIKKIGVIM